MRLEKESSFHIFACSLQPRQGTRNNRKQFVLVSREKVMTAGADGHGLNLQPGKTLSALREPPQKMRRRKQAYVYHACLGKIPDFQYG
jgi:hypothetical protein